MDHRSGPMEGFTSHQASRLTSCTPRQLRYWRRKGYVPAAQRVGKAWVYDLPTFKLLRLIADLLRAYDPPRPVRLLGVRVASFESEAEEPAEPEEERDQLQLGLTA